LDLRGPHALIKRPPSSRDCDLRFFGAAISETPRTWPVDGLSESLILVELTHSPLIQWRAISDARSASMLCSSGAD
jgi:hypothetical protein